MRRDGGIFMEQNVKVMQEKAVLVGLNCDLFTKEEAANERTLDELEALLETAGGVCVGKILQNRHEPDPHSFIGEGKAEEVREWVQNTGATLVIFDNDLTPSQVRALEEATKAHVLDRSALILDIFAQRAKTREGKLQVELAQYKYYLPRLTTWNEEMGRLGGGIGTRGPGETQLETDKRHIRARISKLQSELKEVRKIRAVQRERRMKNDVPVICLVGYTNAGKSTLLNALTGAGIPANNRLFDTLDTTSRQLTVSDTCQAILSDTVGFIAKLPHHLIEAFQATLEELQYADLILHVIDASDPDATTISRSRSGSSPSSASPARRSSSAITSPTWPRTSCSAGRDGAVAISAKTGEGLPQLLELIEKELDRGLHHVKLLLPYSAAGLVDLLHQKAKVTELSYEDGGIVAQAVVDEQVFGKIRDYVVTE